MRFKYLMIFKQGSGFQAFKNNNQIYILLKFMLKKSKYAKNVVNILFNMFTIIEKCIQYH